MSKEIKLSLVVCSILALALLPAAQTEKGKSRPLETKNWMKAVNNPQCSALGKLLKEGPSDDAGWQAAAQHAQLLNEASYVLMEDGRCPDAVWAGAAKQLRERSQGVLKAIEAKNAGDARTAFQGVVEACNTCHSAHRKK